MGSVEDRIMWEEEEARRTTCKQCGQRKVEDCRELWATPVCFACVPETQAEKRDANERAMRQLDARDCDAINALIPDPGNFNYGRGR